jgi:hypothetical protein
MLLKKIGAIVLEFALILFLGLILLIVSTGGFSFTLGPLSIKAHSFKNPTIGLITTLLLRKILSGKFFQEFICLAPLRKRFAESQRVRILALVFPLFLLLLIMGFAVAVRPLRYGLIGNYYKFLVLISLLIGFSSRRLFVPVLRSSFIGRAYAKCCSWLIEENVPKQAFPASPKESVTPFLIALVGYTLLSLVWTYPLIKYFSTKMFGWGGDRYIYLWNMWWMKKALMDLHTNPLYTDYLFYPKGISLAFHDFSLLLTSISLPLQGLLTLEEIYNILYLLTFILGGGGCFLLVRYLTGDNLAAFLSGIVFAFWGGRAYYVDHFYLASIQWFPYCALYLIKTLRERSYRNPLLAAIFLAMNALTSWVYAIYMALFVALFLLYSAWTERDTVFTMVCLKRFGLAGAFFTLMMVPVTYPMVVQILEGQQYMNAPVISGLSASPNVLFLPNPNHGILGKYITYLYVRAGFPVPEGLTGGLFIGYTVLLLCLYTELKLKHLKQRFWVLTAFFFLLLSLGPHLQLFSKVYSWIPLPYLILDRIPVLKTVRVPERFVIMVMFCCSVSVGYACWDIFRRIRFRNTVFFTLVGLTLFEFFRFYLINPVEKTPEFYKTLGQDPETYSILELTRLTELPHAARRSSLFQITHGKKLFNGFIARVPQETYNQAYRLYRIFDDFLTQPREYLEQPDPSVLKVDQKTLVALLSYYNVRYVTLYYDYWYGSARENPKRLVELFGQPIAQEPGLYLFKVEPTPVSESLVFPGHRMFPLKFQANGILMRQAGQDGDIWIVNVDRHQKVQLRFRGRSTILPKEVRVQIFVNNQLITTVQIGDWVKVSIPPVAIQPGENTIRLHMPDIKDWYSGIYMRRIKVDLL